MDKQPKRKFCITFLLIICIILLPSFSSNFGEVYGVTAGTTIVIPDEIKPLAGATYEMEDISWASGTNQKKINEIWVSQGKPKDENNWAYITINGQIRYLVAVAPTFGTTGDYLDVYLETGEIYPCIMGDAKSSTDSTAYYYNGIHLGHTSSGKCNVLELILKDYTSTPSGTFLQTLGQVTQIVNGGSYFDYPDGPVGATGVVYTVTGTSSSDTDGDTESDTFMGAIGSVFRNIWSGLAAFFENFKQGTDDMITVMYNWKLSSSTYIADSVGFSITEETPTDYDVEIDAEDLIDYEKIPVLQTSIEDVLYGSDGLLDVNFLNINSSNENESWQFIQSVVSTVYKATTYVGAAAMLTLLIVVAVMLVMNSMSIKPNTPQEGIRNRKFIEQWIKSVALLVMMVVIINLVVFGSESIASSIGSYSVDEDNITIYVTNSTNTSGDEVDYYFSTNLEGMLMFQSQYNWEDYAVNNVVNMIVGFIVTVFKIVLYLIFLVRMVIVAILVMVAPIVVLIDGAMQINGREGILKNWIKIFLYLVLLKPVIAIMYYLFATSNVYLVSKMPLYILLVFIMIGILFVFSIKLLNRSLGKKSKGKSQ